MAIYIPLELITASRRWKRGKSVREITTERENEKNVGSRLRSIHGHRFVLSESMIIIH